MEKEPMKFEAKPDEIIGSSENPTRNIEGSIEIAQQKLEVIMQPDFYNYAVRFVSVAEFEEIMRDPTRLEGKEVSMPNHSYSRSDFKRGGKMDDPRPPGSGINYHFYKYQDEKRPERMSEREDDFGEVSQGESFVEWLHHDQIKDEKSIAHNEKNKDKEGFYPEEVKNIRQEDWAWRAKESTHWSRGVYELALILDIDAVGKPNPSGPGMRAKSQWGFIHFNKSEDAEVVVGEKILGVVELQANQGVAEKLADISSHAGESAYPVFTPKGEVAFPKVLVESANIDESFAEQKPSEYLSKLLQKVYGNSLDTKLEFYSEDDWELVTIHFKDASVTLSKEARKLSTQEVAQLVEELKEYRDKVRKGDKANPKGMGGAGSVYEIGNEYLIKESTDVDEENRALQHSYDLQQVINQYPSFPSNIRLVHSLAIVEPPFSRRFAQGKKRHTSNSFPYDTIYGEETDQRLAEVGAYIIMPNITNAVQLEDLLPSKRKEGSQAELILNKLLQDKVIESIDEAAIKNFIRKQTQEIIEAFDDAQQDVSAYEHKTLGDSSPRNILLRLENDGKTGFDQIVYYKIDH